MGHRACRRTASSRFAVSSSARASCSASSAVRNEQWLEEQCDLGLLVVDIDDYLDEIMDE
jgi:hypothetical protein